MTDMLVKLYELPPLAPVLDGQRAAGIDVRRALVPEKHRVLAWIADHFQTIWVNECEVSFARLPVACFVAVQDDDLLGFACYDSGFRGFFGPTGVSEAARGKGTGAALLLVTLHDMWAQGYAYGIINWTGPQAFYTRIAGAIPIDGSRPGPYRGLLDVSE